jgi:hypothetical protein
MSNYMKFRGRCKELSEDAMLADPTLTLVRGHYWCPIWNTEEAHWWCVKPDGTVVDPSRLQFPSTGHGIYTPFDGHLDCAECGKDVLEEDAVFESNYTFCSVSCLMRFVGL